MKNLIYALLVLVGYAQALTSTASYSKSLSAVDSAIVTDTRGYNSASYQLTGTWNATVKFEGTVNGTTWITVYAVNQNGGAVDSIATANGVYLLSGNGFKSVRARVSARTSGTVVVQTLATEGSGVVSLLNQSSAGASSNVAVTTSALPTGAATSAKQSDGSHKTQVVDGSGNVIGATSNALDVNIKSGASSGAVAQGSTTSGQTGGLTQAAVTTAAPSYTTAQTSPLSLTTGGALRVDASAASLTVGTHAVTQSGTWTVQPGNTANTTAWKVDGSAVTQPVSAASLPLPSLAATSTKQSDGTQKTQIVDGSGNVIASTSNNLNVQCANCSGSGASAADAASFTAGSSSMAPAGAFYQTTATSNPLTNGQQGMLQATANRALMVNLRDASGAEVSVGGGTQYAEDQASADGHTGTVGLAVRKATPANTSGTDGDYEALQMSAGRLWVDASGKTLTVDGSGVTQPVSGTVTANAGTGTMAVSLASVPSHAVTNAGTFSVQATSVPTDPFGANADAASATGSISAKLRFIASTGIPVTGTVTVGSHAVTNAGTFAVQAGQAAHDAAISGAPVRIGARAMSADYAAVATGDAADVLASLLGKVVTLPYALPAASWRYAAAAGGLVNTTGVTAKTAGGSGVRNYVTSVQCMNSHQSIGTEIEIRDGASGTPMWRGWAQPGGGGFAPPIPVSLRGTANTLVEIAEVTATATAGVLCNLQGYEAAE